MQVTELGRKAIKDPQLRAYLLDVAITQLVFHKVPHDEFEDALRFIVTTYLGAVPYKKRYRPAWSDEIIGWEKVLAENAALVEPIVQETIAGALVTQRETGL